MSNVKRLLAAEYESKDQTVKLRASSAQVASWQAAADAAGIALSKWIRRTLDTAAQSGGGK